MSDAAAFLSELENRHQESFRNLVANHVAGLGRENLPIADVLKLEIKSVIEAVEVAALWLPDSETLQMKFALAVRCGDGARQFERLAERLAVLGVPLGSFDARQGGYSKLYAYFRSLQTTEERTAAGFLTMSSMNLVRMQALARFCEEKGDTETAQMYASTLAAAEERHLREGRQILLTYVTSEESQARARRSVYRTIELVGELNDPGLLRKFLKQSLRK